MIIDYFASRCRSIAVAGVRFVLRSQPNAKLHAVATGLVALAGSLARLSAREWCWIITAVIAVWAAESLNTALELLADAVCPQRHPLVGHAKDVAAGAVLLIALGAAMIGACIFGSRIIQG